MDKCEACEKFLFFPNTSLYSRALSFKLKLKFCVNLCMFAFVNFTKGMYGECTQKIPFELNSENEGCQRADEMKALNNEKATNARLGLLCLG